MSHRRGIGVGIAAVVLFCAGIAPASARTYAAYYDCTEGKETALTVSSLSEFEGEVACSVTIFDPAGGIVAERGIALTSYSSAVLWLSRDARADEAARWGIVLVDSPALLSLSVWIGDDAGWIAAENITARILYPEEITSAYYWLTLSYANTPHRTTGIALLNPHPIPVEGAIWLHDVDGKPLGSDEFVLAPRAALYFSPEREFPRVDANWGVVDVRAAAPILLVGEYFGAGGELIDVDLIPTPYYQQATGGSGG